jgi:hypothetical protein
MEHFNLKGVWCLNRPQGMVTINIFPPLYVCTGNISSMDLLEKLLSAKDVDTGVGLSQDQLRDHVMTFMLAGHEVHVKNIAFFQVLDECVWKRACCVLWYMH